MADIHKADPGARRMVVAIVGCAAVIGAVLISAATRFRPEVEAWLEQDLSARFRFVVAALMILTSGPLLGLAAYLWRLGRRIGRVERYPPPGLRLVRDTPVVTGLAAGQLGRRVQLFAVVLGCAALLLAFLLWRLVALLRASAA